MNSDGIIKKTAILLGVMLALIFAIGFMLPSAFHVERTLVVNAGVKRVFPMIHSLNEWPKWDPWSHADKGIEHIFSGPEGVGRTLSWSGPRSGKGKLRIIESTPLEKVKLELLATKENNPRFWTFQLEDLGGKTRLTWAIDGENSLQPIGNYFGLGMDRYFGPMYEQGLSNLKALIETGKLPVIPGPVKKTTDR